MTDVLVSAVIVTWNSAEVVGDLLDVLVEVSKQIPLEAVIVDNGSQDCTVDLVRGHPLGARVIENGGNRGLAAANNQGIVATKGAYVLICNPDIVPSLSAVQALLDTAARHERAAFVVGRLVGRDGALQPGVGDLPTFREAFRGRRAALLARRDTGFWWDGWAHDEERRIGHGQEACYLVRREAIAEIGLQDEEYRLDWEGVDWSARAADRGWEVWFCPQAEVVHLGGASMAKARVRWVLGSHRGMYRYFAARGPAWRRPGLRTLIAARCAVKLVMLVRPNLYERGTRAPQTT